MKLSSFKFEYLRPIQSQFAIHTSNSIIECDQESSFHNFINQQTRGVFSNCCSCSCITALIYNREQFADCKIRRNWEANIAIASKCRSARPLYISKRRSVYS